jgi:putative sugar O-methyltransferase
MDKRIDEMYQALSSAPPEILPSEFWKGYNQKNLAQLEQSGYDNFKQTAALNYFTFVAGFRDPQINHLVSQLPTTSLPGLFWRTLTSGKHALLSWKGSMNYNLITHLVWEFARQHDPDQLLERLHEPEEGNPPRVMREDRLISQDLANSMLEYRAVMESDELTQPIHTVMELGAGYGRTAYVYLSLQPGLRYLVVDIPPALYLAERYLSSQFKDRRIFRFRPFSSFAEIEDEFNQAQIAFLLPNQLELLPDKGVDLFINISSLHEMRRDQINFYLDQINRLTRHYFYCKQWKESVNAADSIVVKEADYPFPASWKRLYRRDGLAQNRFFETLFAL